MIIGIMPISMSLIFVGLIIWAIFLRSMFIVIGPEGILTDRGGGGFYLWSNPQTCHNITGEMKAFSTQPSAKRFFIKLISQTGTTHVRLKFADMESDDIHLPDLDRRMKNPVHQAIMAHICFIYHEKQTEIVGPDTEYITRYFNAPGIYELTFRENIRNQTSETDENLSAKFDYSGVLVALFAPRIMGLIQDTEPLVYKRLVDQDYQPNSDNV